MPRGPVTPPPTQGRGYQQGGAGEMPAKLLFSTMTATSPLVEDAVLAQEPGVHDLPLVPSPRLEVQKLGSPVLQIEIEFERVPAGGRAGGDRLVGEPTVPFPNDEIPQILLFHSYAPKNRWSPVRRARVVALVCGASGADNAACPAP